MLIGNCERRFQRDFLSSHISPLTSINVRDALLVYLCTAPVSGIIGKMKKKKNSCSIKLKAIFDGGGTHTHMYSSGGVKEYRGDTSS